MSGGVQGGVPGCGELTVRARLSGGAARSAAPSVPEGLVYAALLYPDGGTSSEFVSGEADGSTVTFLFQKPAVSENLTLEVLAFEGGTAAEDFMREGALLAGSRSGLKVEGGAITVDGPVALMPNMSAAAPGEAELRVAVPDGCALRVDDTARFVCEGAPPEFTIRHAGDGIPAGAYPLALTVERNGAAVYGWTETVNVFPGMRADTWSGLEAGAAREITREMLSTTVYVRGAGGWYDGSPYAATATASDGNGGSFLAPFATIQKAIDTVVAANDGSSEYTVYVDGTLTLSETKDAMADVESRGSQALALKIVSLHPTQKATLDANGKAQTVIHLSNSKAILNSTTTLERLVITGGKSTSANARGSGINIAYQENVSVVDCEIKDNTGAMSGGGIWVYENSGTLSMKGCTVSGNSASDSGGGMYVANGRSDAITVEGCTFSDNTAHNGGGIFYFAVHSGDSDGPLVLKDCTVSNNTATDKGGGIINRGKITIENTEVSGNTATSGAGICSFGGTVTLKSGAKVINNIGGGGICATGQTGSGAMHALIIMEDGAEVSGNTSDAEGGGVLVNNGSVFTMSGGIISGNTANKGGGVYVDTDSEFKMEAGAVISKNTAIAASYVGGGVYNDGVFEMKDNAAISKNTATKGAGGGVYVGSTGEFTMKGGTISENKTMASSGYGAGGVYVSTGTFKMDCGKISGNTAAFGGGVGIANRGTFYMIAGEISGNTAKTPVSGILTEGGGVKVNGGTFTMSGGEVKGNTGGAGAGIYVYYNDTFTMTGAAKVAYDNDIYLDYYAGSTETYIAKIQVDGALTATSPVATITPKAYEDGRQVLEAVGGGKITQAVCDQFMLTPAPDDGDWKIVPDSTGAYGVLALPIVYLNSSTGADTNSGLSAANAVATLSKAVELFEAKNASKIVVCATYTLPSSEISLLDRMGGGKRKLTLLRYDGSSDVSDAFKGNLLAISSGNVTISNVTLDGNKENVCTDTTETSGHLLHITGSTTVVTLGDDATVCDNKKVSGRGSGVYIGGGTFKMAGGTVTGNEAGYGAGIYIYNDAIFEISGGAISENKATSTYGGGGVYVRGTFKMTDGTISSNSAMNGGGVYIPTVGVGSFTMDGGRIIGNTASSKGGGVYVNGTFTMSGGEITGNTAGSSGNGVYKTSDGTFTRTGGTVQSD